MADLPVDALSALTGGKRVHQHTYIHVSLLDEQNDALRILVDKARRRAGIDRESYNVIRFSHVSNEIGLLSYPQFFEDPFPSLEISYLVDLSTKRVTRTDFSSRDNPPILHRKELFLSPDHPCREKFAQLTAALVERGVFAESRRIGFRRFWEEKLSADGVKVVDHVVKEVAIQDEVSDVPADVARHRTAIARDRLSAPMQALARHGLLISERTVLDYGCGQGDDVRALKGGGITVTGWDPHFSPDVKREQADIVNLGFVLNVIEEPAERVQAVRDAFGHARQLLAVAVMVVGKGDTNELRSYRDGYLTQRDTFQKYYRQEEIKEFLDASLDMEAIPVGPGVFFIFRDKILEQRFLLDRQRRIQFAIAPEFKPPADRPTLADRHFESVRPIVQQLWQKMLEFGRPLVEEEVSPALLLEIKEKIGSIRKAERLGRTPENDQNLDTARRSRIEDLLVYFGLNVFNARNRYSTLAPELQRDVSLFFGNGKKAFEAGRALLFSVGKSEVIEGACKRAHATGLGLLDEGNSLIIHSALLNRLPAVLRCYVGCAAKLYGDVDTADLIKIHIRSGKLTLLFYDEFESSPLPSLRDRIKINMREQRIDFFQHKRDERIQLLYLKSQYMAEGQPGYRQQKAFDDTLSSIGAFDFSEHGPSKEAFDSKLTELSLQVSGFQLEKVSS